MLTNITNRVFLADKLRYATSYSPHGLDDTWTSYLFWDQLKALELHLLCTCIDALAGQGFISFEEWLQSNKSGKKQQYGLNEDESKIQRLLGRIGPIDSPDKLRSA